MESRHIAWQTIGGALLAVGGASLVVVLIWDVSTPTLHLWDDLWFKGLIAFLGLLTVVGAYGLFAPVAGWPLPPTRTEPFWRRRPRLSQVDPVDPTKPITFPLPVELAPDEIVPVEPPQRVPFSGEPVYATPGLKVTETYPDNEPAPEEPAPQAVLPRNPRIAIQNEGIGNTFVGNRSRGHDIGFLDRGKDTLAAFNDFEGSGASGESRKKKRKRSQAKRDRRRNRKKK